MGNSFKSRLVTFDEIAEKGKLFIVSVELDDHFFLDGSLQCLVNMMYSAVAMAFNTSLNESRQTIQHFYNFIWTTLDEVFLVI